MSGAENANRSNGAASGTAWQSQDAHSLGDHGRQIHHDARVLAAAVQDATADLERYFTEQATRRPYRTLGVAAGIGYVLGGGLSSRLTAVLLGAATRLTVALAARELGARMLHGASASVQTKSPDNAFGAAKEQRSDHEH